MRQMYEVEALQNLENPEVLVPWDVIHDITDQLADNRVNGTSKPGTLIPLEYEMPLLILTCQN